VADVELQPASDLSDEDVAALFTASYEGYLVPFAVDAAAVRSLTETCDLDRAASVIAVRDGERVGLANLGLRGREAWVGGVGVVPAERRRGTGRRLMHALHENARSHGVERVWLEVIVENTSALALYEKLGYELVQDVELWTLPAAEGEHAGREVSVSEVKAQLPERHEPWQRADGTLSHYDDVRGFATETGAMLFCVRSSVQLQQYTGEPAPLLRALRTFGDLYVLNLPADDPAAAVLRELGGSVTVRQHEMLLEL